MKFYIFLLLFAINLTTFAQEENTTEIELKEVNEEPEEVSFAIIENVPVYSGCDENMGSQALKQCMGSQISTLISKNFNINKTRNLNLPEGKVRIMVFFKIGVNGEIKDIKVDAPHTELEKETIRVIKLIPNLDKPGYYLGKPVVVPYSLPIVFTIDNKKPLSKSEQKKRNKKNNKV
jgi:protein TonB